MDFDDPFEDLEDDPDFFDDPPGFVDVFELDLEADFFIAAETIISVCKERKNRARIQRSNRSCILNCCFRGFGLFVKE